MDIYAHRGYSAVFPENTLEAFQGALDLGVFGVELDIHASADGIPVVIHDDDVDRTTSGSGLVSSMTAAELAKLDAGNGNGVPTFEEVVALANGRLHFDIEIKEKNCERGVLDVLKRYPQTPAVISAFDWEVLATCRALSPDVTLWVLDETVTDGAIKTARELGAPKLAVDHKFITQRAMERAKAAGLQIMAWTVNSQDEANRLRDLGVASICTDDPSAVR